MMRAAWIAIALAGCATSGEPEPTGVVVALTIDWEGADLSPAGLASLDKLRARLGPIPLTHFVTAAYLTKAAPAGAAQTIANAVRPGDELAVHLHAWRSLAEAAGLAPRLSPSFLTGTDEVLVFDDGDVGFDVDLDAYDVPELRALLRTSRKLLEQTGRPVSRSFRAGAYLATPKLRQAIRDEGYLVDSSAVDARQLEELAGTVLQDRIAPLWPKVDSTTQPWRLDVPGGSLIELPIAAIADYATTAELDKALARTPVAGRNVLVVLAFHLETADDYAQRIGDAIDHLGARRGEVSFVTVERAAELSR